MGLILSGIIMVVVSIIMVVVSTLELEQHRFTLDPRGGLQVPQILEQSGEEVLSSIYVS